MPSLKGSFIKAQRTISKISSFIICSKLWDRSPGRQNFYLFKLDYGPFLKTIHVLIKP